MGYSLVWWNKDSDTWENDTKIGTSPYFAGDTSTKNIYSESVNIAGQIISSQGDVKYRIYHNGVIIQEETSFIPTPINININFNNNDLKLGVNLIEIKYETPDSPTIVTPIIINKVGNNIGRNFNLVYWDRTPDEWDQTFNDKILIFNNGVYKSHHPTSGWFNVSANPTEQDYLEHGMSLTYLSSLQQNHWQQLQGDITISYFTDNFNKTQVLFEVETEPYTFIEEMRDSVKVLYFTDNPEKEEAFIEFEPADKKFRNFTRYALSKDGRQNWYVYKDGKWLRININDIYEKGMTKEELEALTSEEFEKWFERGTLDFVIGLWKENEVEEQIISSMIFKFPENQGPTITNLHATPDAIHNEAITIKALIKDLEGDQVQYRILVNGRQVRGWRSVPFEYHVNQALFFSHDYFKVGNNIITIEAQDDRGALNSASTSVFVSNTIPKIIITKITDFAVEGCIGDDDNDKIQYRVLINGKQFYPTNKEWTDLKDSPISFRHSWTSKNVFVGQDNIIRIEFRDEYGQGGSWQGIIQGRYFNLMFKDEFGDYLSTDREDILKILDMGSIIAGQTSFDYEVILENSTDMHVKDVHIYVDKYMLPQGVNIEFSRTRNPFIAEDDIRYDEPMEPQEMRSFYIRITTTANARYGGQFYLRAEGTPVL